MRQSVSPQKLLDHTPNLANHKLAFLQRMPAGTGLIATAQKIDVLYKGRSVLLITPSETVSELSDETLQDVLCTLQQISQIQEAI